MKLGSKIGISLGILGIVVVVVTAFTLYNYKPDYYKYYRLDNSNSPCLYNIDNHEIKVVIGDMNEEEYNNTLWALNHFDAILENDIVKVYKEEEVTNNHYIKIESVKKINYEDSDPVGICYYIEPILIQIEHSLGNRYWVDSKKSVFGKVVLHELGHVLGLIDLYDDSYKGTSIMYHTYAGAQEYTNLDIENIRRYY